MDTSKISALQPPPSPQERLRKVLNILDELNAEYAIDVFGKHYERKSIKN